MLVCAAGHDNDAVARQLRVTPATVGKRRNRFVQDRLKGLYDEPRPGAPRAITDEQVEQVVVHTLESTPRGATHGSTREMAKATGCEGFKLSPDPLLVPKVRNIVGLYIHPPEHAVVLCVVDEKSQIQALDRAAPLLPMRPGQAERHTHDYKRHGTTSLFAALDVQSGKVLGQTRHRHRSLEFRKFLDRIAAKTPLVRAWFAKRPRFHVHFTPTYGSWSNQVERGFAELTMKQICRGAHRSVSELERAISEFLDAHNAHPKPFAWTKSADQILATSLALPSARQTPRPRNLCHEPRLQDTSCA